MSAAARRRGEADDAGASPSKRARHEAKQVALAGARGEPGRDGDDQSTQVDDEDDGEIDVDALTQAAAQNTQLALTQAPRDWSSSKELPHKEADDLVAVVMRKMLFAHHKGGGAPVKRTDLAKEVNSRYTQQKRGLADFIIAEAQVTFPQLLGFEMRAVERVVKPAGGGAGARRLAADSEERKEMTYVLRSCLAPQLRAKYAETDEGRAWAGLCATVVSLVSVAGGQLNESGLWGYLAQLGVQRDSIHPQFGDTALVLKALVDRRVLRAEKPTSEDGETQYSVAEYGADALPEAKLIGLLKTIQSAEPEEEDVEAAS